MAVTLAENPNDDAACAMAEEVLKTSGGSLVRLAEVDFARLRMTAGMGRMRALKLLATMELGRRVTVAEASAQEKVLSDRDIALGFPLCCLRRWYRCGSWPR